MVILRLAATKMMTVTLGGGIIREIFYFAFIHFVHCIIPMYAYKTKKKFTHTSLPVTQSRLTPSVQQQAEVAFVPYTQKLGDTTQIIWKGL